MWKCRICDHKTKKLANVFRHLKLVHGIVDRDCKNVCKDTDTGVESCGKDLTSKESNGQLPRMTSVGRSMTGERHLDQADSEDYGEHCTEMSYRCQTQTIPVDGQYTRAEIEILGAGLRARKCRILDVVLKTIPDHLKAKAEIVCDALKCRDDVFINPGYELIVDGTLIRGSNICNLIMNNVTHPPSTGSEQIKQVESEKKLLKRERDVPMRIKFESIVRP